MIRIKCPYCGERDHSEFTYGGDGSVEYPPLDDSTEKWVNAIFFRDNICGKQIETWHHTNGCRLWLKIERDTRTHEIFSIEPAHKDILIIMKENK